MTETANVKRGAPDIVRDALREGILNGTIQPGTQMRQDELAEQFGVSRIPIREALRQLEVEGLVKIELNRGAVVSRLSTEDVLEMLDIRIALECYALRLAIPNMAEQDFTLAEGLLDIYDQEPDPVNWGRMNRQFHLAICAPCDRPRLMAMIRDNMGRADLFLRTEVSLVVGKERPQQEHRQLLELIRAGDAEEAARLLQSHIEQTRRSVQATMRHRKAS